MLDRYIYDGPIMSFDKCMVDKWKGETSAPSKQKARSNLTYQAKKQLKLLPGVRITLPGEIKMANLRGD